MKTTGMCLPEKFYLSHPGITSEDIMPVMDNICLFCKLL